MKKFNIYLSFSFECKLLLLNFDELLLSLQFFMCIVAFTDHVIAPAQCKIKNTCNWTNFWHISNKKVANLSADFFYNASNAMPGILTTTRPQYTGERRDARARENDVTFLAHGWQCLNPFDSSRNSGLWTI